jgi:hypothetical protein
MCGGERHAGVHSSHVIRGRLGPHQLLDQIKQDMLFAPRAGQQRAHGDGKIGGGEHLKTFQDRFNVRKPEIS